MKMEILKALNTSVDSLNIFYTFIWNKQVSVDLFIYLKGYLTFPLFLVILIFEAAESDALATF